ncbi:hypothetical protein BH10PAT3_BH10PAT3_7650 [soil metagenome]
MSKVFERCNQKMQRIDANPVAELQRHKNRFFYGKEQAKRWGIAVVALAAVAHFTEGGVTGLLGSADKGTEWMLEAGNSENEGVVAPALNWIGHSISGAVSRVVHPVVSGSPVKTSEGGLAPEATIGSTALPICPTEPVEYTLGADGQAKYVSTAVYDVNGDYLPALGGSKLSLDNLWKDNFSLDNNGEDPNAPADANIVVRQIVPGTDITSCVIG